MAHALETPLAPLVRDYRELRSRGAPLVLATILATEGSAYRKAGTQMLVTASLEPRGLLSGGCLEVDLVEHAREVLDIGARTPEAIALAAAGELHAWIAGRGGGAWHEKLRASQA